MPKKHKCPECPPKGAPAYMNTYGDMMTLLVTFFVLLISYSTIEQQKFTIAMSSLKGALGVLAAQGTNIPIANMPLFQIGRGQIDDIVDAEVRKIEEEIKKLNLNDDENIQVTPSKDQLHFSISAPMLFASGQAILRDNTQLSDLLGSIANILNLVPFEIRIEGHTDTDRMPSGRFVNVDGNWELSYARGLALAQRFSELGVAESRFQIIGYGAQRPVADNTTEEGKRLNRRVEIIVNLRDELRRSLLPGE